MANRDESHLFSLAALTTRTPVPPPGAPSPVDDDGSVAFDAAPEHRVSALGAGFSLFPLGAPLGNHAPLAPSAIEAARPTPETGRTRTLALVALASLVGAGIVLVAVWSSQSPEPPPNLARPEVLTNTLVPPPTPVQNSPALAPVAEPAPAEPPSASESQSGSNASQRNRHAHARPNTNQARTRPPAVRAPAPTPAPARGPCSHCSPHDLACNIKCRAK